MRTDGHGPVPVGAAASTSRADARHVPGGLG